MSRQRLLTAASTCVWAVVSATVLTAQAPAGPPKPGPEHKQLEYFVGKWTSEGEMKPSPWGPGGKTSGKDACELFTGGYHVVCRGESTGPMGMMKTIGLLGYNVDEKSFTYLGIDSMGSNDVARGTMTGPDTWIYTAGGMMGGKNMKTRYTIKKIDADNYTFKAEMAGDDGVWKTAMEGKNTRLKSGTS